MKYLGNGKSVNSGQDVVESKSLTELTNKVKSSVNLYPILSVFSSVIISIFHLELPSLFKTTTALINSINLKLNGGENYWLFNTLKGSDTTNVLSR
tara:strand:- start:589 stop:876 length:288 start_codon:yes stop_codon:yes gene_type:complete